MKHPHRNGKRAQRQQSAAERQEVYVALSRDEKIKRTLRARGFSNRQLLRLGIDLSDPSVSLP